MPVLHIFFFSLILTNFCLNSHLYNPTIKILETQFYAIFDHMLQHSEDLITKHYQNQKKSKETKRNNPLYCVKPFVAQITKEELKLISLIIYHSNNIFLCCSVRSK